MYHHHIAKLKKDAIQERKISVHSYNYVWYVNSNLELLKDVIDKLKKKMTMLSRRSIFLMI